MSEPRTPNLLLYVTDALRWDHHPDDLPGTTIQTITEGVNTPVCFPSLLSGQPGMGHDVQWFFGVKDEVQCPTVFDLESEGYDVSYFDNPLDRMFDVFRNPPFQPLQDLEEPFVYVERAVETHTPYSYTWRELDEWSALERPDPGEPRTYPEDYTGEGWSDGKDYIELMRRGEIDYHADYEAAVEMARRRFEHLLDVLEERGLLEETYVVWTSDHGECFPSDSCDNMIHERPCPHTKNVGTTVYDRDVSIETDLLHQRNLLSLWDERWVGGREDLPMVEREPRDDDIAHQAKEAAEARLRDLGYL